MAFGMWLVELISAVFNSWCKSGIGKSLSVFQMAWRPCLLLQRGKELAFTEGARVYYCGGLLSACFESQCSPPQLLAHCFPCPRDETISTGEYCLLTCCLFTSQSPPTIVHWPDSFGPKWLSLESQLPAVVVL